MASQIFNGLSKGLLSNLLALPPALRRTVFTSSQPELFDVVCVGGGPAGLSFLSALRANPSTQRLKIALIDGQDLTTSRSLSEPDVYSNRCSSLTPNSVRFLRDVGVWDRVDAGRVQRYHGMEVWDGVSGSKISFDPLDGKGGLLESVAELVPGSRFAASRRRYEMTEESGVVATMCENSNLTAALLQQLKDVQGVEILDKTKVESIQLGPEPANDEEPDLSLWPIVTLPNERKLAARLLVGADGANSPVRNFGDIASNGWDYNQHGIVATLKLDRSFDEHDYRIAYQRFLPSGPIALLPLPNNKASLVWSITTPLANKIKQLSPSDFLSILNAAFRLEPLDLNYLLTSEPTTTLSEDITWRLSNTPSTRTGLPRNFPQLLSVQENSLASFPLRLRHANTYTGHRLALLGDAAHTVHPLAGQGLNLGLADAESLAARLAYGVEHGMDIGTCWCLEGYGADRWAKNSTVLGVCDKLQKLYGVGSGPVVWGRSFGVEVLQRLGGLKGVLMGAAGGGK